MTLLRRAKEITDELAAIAQRKKLDVMTRRIESRIKSELEALGRELYPLLKSGQLQFDSARVRDNLAAIAAFEDERRDNMARIEALEKRDKERFVDASIVNIDNNATFSASERQTASDRTADHQGNPAEQGGQG